MARKKSAEAEVKVDWHRLFGLVLKDVFAGSPFVVETEKDLSVKKQWLDVVILRKGKGEVDQRLPDGLEDLVNFNLITYKSHHEALDDWALKELTGHYVNYRKQVSPSKDDLLPEAEFNLYAVCIRYPHNLANRVTFQPIKPGVYDCQRGTDHIRVIVVSQLPETPHNASLHLFSASGQQLDFARKSYQVKSEDATSLLYLLIQGYLHEKGATMPVTLEEFSRDFYNQHGDEIAKLLSPEQMLPHLSAQQRIHGLTPEQRVEGLSSQELLRLAEERRRQEEAAQPKKPRKRKKS